MLRILSLLVALAALVVSIKKRRVILGAALLFVLAVYDSFPTIREVIIPGGWSLNWIGFPAFFPIPVYPNGGLQMHPVWYSVVLLVLGGVLLFCLLRRKVSS